MKKYKFLLSLLLVLLFQFQINAQTDPGRTVKTKIVDALAKLPAQDDATRSGLITELLQTGDEGVFILTSMMQAPGKGDNTTMEYALSGMARFVLQNAEKEGMRKQLAESLIKALDKTTEPEVKFFILTQIQLIAKEECVAGVTPYLSDERLCDVATRTLVRVNSEAAQQAVLKAIPSAKGTCLNSLIKAAGDMQITAAEELVTAQTKASDKILKQVALDALARLGSVQSIETLATLAKEENYGYDGKSTATDAYLVLLNRLAANEPAIVEKKAANLLKVCEADNQLHVKCTALNLLIQMNGEKALPLVLKALSSDSRKYRQAALLYTSNSLKGEAVQKALLKKLKGAKADAKIDILDYFSIQRNPSVVESLIPYIANKETAVSLKAISAIGLIGGDAALAALCEQLKGTDEAKLAAAEKALAIFKGDISKTLLASVDQYTLLGQKTAVALLGKRGCVAASDKVFSMLTSSDAPVVTAAYTALAGVSTEKDLPRLFKLMEAQSDATKKFAVQNAILAAGVKEADLIKQMDGKSAKIQGDYYYLLGRVGSVNTAILDKLFGLLQSDNKENEGVALQNLNIRADHAAVIRRSFATAAAKSALAGKLFPVIMNHIAAGEFTPERQLIFLREAFKIAGTDENKNKVLQAVGSAKTLQALLFAGQFLNTPALQQSAAVSVMDIALSNPMFKGEEVTAYLNKVIEVIAGQDSQYQKEAIRKHLSEMDQTPGFVSLFNGKDLTGWKGLVENPIARAKMSASKLAAAQKKADEVMKAGWQVVNGELMFTGKGDNLCTDKKYGDFEMIVDWKLDPAGPEPDAGIYLRGTPQVQIWDIARTDVGAQVGSGGLYNNTKNKSIPTHVADNPLGEWNSFRILMIGDRVTVYLNGELVVDNIIMENYWDRSQPIPALDQIELQAHGSKVYYRDVYVREIERPEPFQLSAEEQKEGFEVLFDGTNMHNWTGNTKDYTLENGCIALYPQGGGGNLYTVKEYKDFIYRFEFQLTPGANNGLGIRAPLEGDAAYVGMELQIIDNEAPIYKDLNIYQYHGSVYGVIPAKRGFLKPVGEWNYEEVVVKGSKVKVILNGTVILDGDIAEASKNGTLDHRDHPGLKNEKGHIGFLGHGDKVKFRNIRVKELK